LHGDITEREQAVAEKDKLEAQLQQAQKMESVGRLAGGVAHDFNNMLGVILGHVEMAMENMDPAEAPLRGNLEEIRKAAERSANLTRQLLAFARKQTVAPKVLDLNETVASMLKMLRRLVGEDIVNLVWLPGAELCPVKVDPSQIDQILANLCVNARDAIGGVGKLTIETANSTFDDDYCATHAEAVPGEYVKLAVTDDGCGMDKATQERIFEPFFTTKGVGKGTGLGLATVYGIVKQNNGFINVTSEPDKGTTFEICLPRHVAGQDGARGKRSH
jgi:two-component system cell cycle sensor histidine kinase/response regulator CckA